MSQESFRQLLYQYISNELTPEEKERLQAMMSQPEYNDALEAFVREIMLSDDYAAIDSPAIKTKIDDYLASRMTETKRSFIPMPMRRLPWLRWTAAASILLIATAAAFFFLNRSGNDISKVPEPVVRLAEDVKAPQNSKAVLTLADGRQISLNDIMSGALTSEGSASITKLEDGRIIYNAKEKPALIAYNTLTVPRGSNPINLTLSDGTRIWVNAASSLKYPAAFTGPDRKVEMTGEAYFEVAHDKTMPFIVKKLNDDTHVQALGTQFNVNAYEDEAAIRVTLLEGSVRVKHGDDAMLIKPGQQAVVATGNMLLNDHPDVEKIMSWKNNEFIFENDDIESIMRELSRWYDIEATIEKPSDRKYIGRINRSVPLSRALGMFEKLGYIRFVIAGKKVSVIPIEK